jgi:hypothetical protein
MAYRKMTSLSQKCKQFLLENRDFQKSDRLYVTCNFSEYLTKGKIEMRVEKLFQDYYSGQRNHYIVVNRQEFDNWEKMKERKEKLIKLKDKIDG